LPDVNEAELSETLSHELGVGDDAEPLLINDPGFPEASV
jgi:hypothetical protein